MNAIMQIKAETLFIFAFEMGKIYLKNIRVYANHGCMVEEGKIGSDYVVNLMVKTDLSLSSKTDRLEDTVDYVALNSIVKDEMAIRSKLLEQVATRILLRILKEHKTVTFAKVKVAKKNPPIGGNVEEVAINRELARDAIKFD